MRSATPKVLHPLCGRPMLAYALDAWASTEAGSVGGRPIVVFSPTVGAVIDAFADRAVFALQDVPRGTGDALNAALAVVPATVDRDPRPVGRRPAGDRRRPRHHPRGAAGGRRRDRPGQRVRRRAGRARPGRPRRVRHGRADRRGARRHRRRAGRQRGQCRAVRLRCRLAEAPDRCPEPVAGDRRAVPDRPDPARPRGRASCQRGRVRGRRPVRRDQRPVAARGRGMDPARAAERGAHAGRRHDARPVHRLSRLDGRAGRGRHARTERHPPRRHDRRRGERHRGRQPAGRRHDRRRRHGSGPASSSRPRSRTRRRSDRSATSALARSSGAGRRSATSPSSRTRISVPARASTT